MGLGKAGGLCPELRERPRALTAVFHSRALFIYFTPTMPKGRKKKKDNRNLLQGGAFYGHS
jgi:hypothetical protein